MNICNDNKRLFYSILSNTRCVNAVPMGCLGVFSAFKNKKKAIKELWKVTNSCYKVCVMCNEAWLSLLWVRGMSGRQAEMTIIIKRSACNYIKQRILADGLMSNFEFVSFSKKIATYELKIMNVLWFGLESHLKWSLR